MAEAAKLYSVEERRELLQQLKPIEMAALVYLHNGHGPDDFAKDIWKHLHDGFVYSLPHVFLMARAVELDDGRAAWLMNSGAGRLRDILSLFPFQLPYVAFNRCGRQKMSVWPFERFQRLANHIPSIKR